MNPELMNNSLFLKYYRRWQDNPSSVVFAPIADFFLQYGMVDEAAKVCSHGMKMNPLFVSGHIVTAKVHLSNNDTKKALESVNAALAIMPDNENAIKLKAEIEGMASPDISGSERQIFETRERAVMERIPSWETVTMANIYVAQGHFDKARRIYSSILKRDPENEEAKRGIQSLS